MAEIATEIRDFIVNGEIKKALSALLKLKYSEQEIINQLTLLASKFNLVTNQHQLGLLPSEEFFLEYSKINHAIIALLEKVESEQIKENQKIKLSILVAGTGRNGLPDQEIWLSEELGKMLGNNQFKLISGGWKGVDKIVSENFSKVIISKHKKKLSLYLTQIVPRGIDPVFLGGDVYYIEPGVNEWIRSLNIADAVITIGGVNWEAANARGGTYMTYEYALQERVPVFPIYGSGGDSVEIFEQMIADWDEDLMGNITKREFIEALHTDVNSRTDAIKVVAQIESMLLKMK